MNETSTFGSKGLAETCNGEYTPKDIEDMETIILQGLEWHIGAPTSLQIAYGILAVLLPHLVLEESTWAYILDEVKFQTVECATRDYDLSILRKSIVARAAIINASEELEVSEDILEALSSVMDDHFAVPHEVLIAARNKLSQVVNSVKRSNTQFGA